MTIDDRTQAWIDAKPDARPHVLAADDPSIDGAAAAIAAARTPVDHDAVVVDLFAPPPPTPIAPTPAPAPTATPVVTPAPALVPVAVAPAPIAPARAPAPTPDPGRAAASVPGTEDAMALFDVAPDAAEVALSLRDRYVVPPFSILDTRQGYWQARKAQWATLGIQSEVGRDAGLAFGAFDNPDVFETTNDQWKEGATSIFDPVLTEIAYRWLAPAGAVIVDPFAGGSVRGIIAGALGHTYVGVELRGEQVEANRAQAQSILRPGSPTSGGGPVVMPRWIEGDSTDATLDLPQADLIFTCPPYADLEVYSDDPRDLSNMSASTFHASYRLAIARAVDRLAPNGFACVVIGNVRDKKGKLRDLVGATISAFEDAGAAYYNEAILLNAVGTGAVRARKQFETSRKLVRMHQTVLVFCNGDPRAATAAIESGVRSARA